MIIWCYNLHSCRIIVILSKFKFSSVIKWPTLLPSLARSWSACPHHFPFAPPPPPYPLPLAPPFSQVDPASSCSSNKWGFCFAAVGECSSPLGLPWVFPPEGWTWSGRGRWEMSRLRERYHRQLEQEQGRIRVCCCASGMVVHVVTLKSECSFIVVLIVTLSVSVTVT